MYFWDETQMEFLVTCVCSSSSVEGVVLLLYIGSIQKHSDDFVAKKSWVLQLGFRNPTFLKIHRRISVYPLS